MSRFQVIAFDADDTLWQTEQFYVTAQNEFKQLLAHYHSAAWIAERLYQTETRNMKHFGYGIKAFALSMIETAVELTEGRITGSEIQRVIDLAKGMLAADIELLPAVAETLARLHKAHALMLLTKGDLRDQEDKLARSGLKKFFRHVEIVSNKTRASYATMLHRHNIAPPHFLMVGNSLRSDILPVLALGGCAIYIPHALTWAHEAADPPPADHPGFFELARIEFLPELLNELERGAK